MAPQRKRVYRDITLAGGVEGMRKRYVLLKDRFEHKAGATIYKCANSDYGCARDDGAVTGQPHTSMTLDPDGDYPFFTVANSDFEACDV